MTGEELDVKAKLLSYMVRRDVETIAGLRAELARVRAERDRWHKALADLYRANHYVIVKNLDHASEWDDAYLNAGAALAAPGGGAP